jgi:hypothetical protein
MSNFKLRPVINSVITAYSVLCPAILDAYNPQCFSPSHHQAVSSFLFQLENHHKLEQEHSEPPAVSIFATQFVSGGSTLATYTIQPSGV